MVAAGTFRGDLYFRINGSHVHLPPLRERREDIPPLVRFAVDKYAAQLSPDAPSPRITDAAMMRLTSYAWPGNVRQLMNVAQSMTVVAMSDAGGGANESLIDVRHVPEEIRESDGPELATDDGGTSAGSLAGTTLEQIEKRAIRETLRLTGGNREQAAKMLGIGERTLYRKLKEYGLR
jgi:two-component system response regulator HydG